MWIRQKYADICAKQRKFFSVFCMYRGRANKGSGPGRIRCDVPGGCPLHKNGFCRTRISPRPGGPSERVWHGGTMTVTVSAGIRHFPDFVLYLAYRKGGQHVQEIYSG